MEIKTEAVKMKMSAPILAASTIEQRNHTLELIAGALEENKERIFEANRMDMEFAERNEIAQAIQKRLKYDENKLKDSINGFLGLRQ